MAYDPTFWNDGDLITAALLNKLEQGVANEQVGPPGPAGADGKDGEPGKDGAPGKDGVDGKDGADGVPGRDGIDGKDGAPGKDGTPGPKGDPGEGVPVGGTVGQVLAKKSAADYDTHWIDPPEGGGTAGVTSFNGRSGNVMPQAGDYTAADVGAATMEQVNTAIYEAITGAIKEAY